MVVVARLCRRLSDGRRLLRFLTGVGALVLGLAMAVTSPGVRPAEPLPGPAADAAVAVIQQRPAPAEPPAVAAAAAEAATADGTAAAVDLSSHSLGPAAAWNSERVAAAAGGSDHPTAAGHWALTGLGQRAPPNR